MEHNMTMSLKHRTRNSYKIPILNCSTNVHCALSWFDLDKDTNRAGTYDQDPYNSIHSYVNRWKSHVKNGINDYKFK